MAMVRKKQKELVSGKRPRLRQNDGRWIRWGTNLGIINAVVDTVRGSQLHSCDGQNFTIYKVIRRWSSLLVEVLTACERELLERKMHKKKAWW